MVQGSIKLALILPELYRGGTLRGAKNIAKMLMLGSITAGVRLELSFGHLYDTSLYHDSDFEDLKELGIKVRPFKREVISSAHIDIVFDYLKKTSQGKKADTYWSFNDGVANFEDCDFWIIVSDRLQHPIPPHRPFAVIVYDYIQRYVPEIFGLTPKTDGNWMQYDAYAKATRGAQFVICTTNQTRLDCINYAGVNHERVYKFPMEFDSLNIQSKPIVKNSEVPPYLLWTTNSTQHKNHINIILGLEHYFKNYPESEIVVYMTGIYTNLFTSKEDSDKHYFDEYPRKVRETIASCPQVKKRLKIWGNLSDEIYLDKLINAYGILHGALYDNGTYSIVEGAWFGVPSISSDYPAIRESCENFSLKPVLFNPRNPKDLAKSLQVFVSNHSQIIDSLPTQERLIERTYSKMAGKYWDSFIAAYEATRD